mmetsp:Transcript_32682/g.59879  ORF Transcript_32682/g.59879 Transcript_32682/m.59879 type:complete len:204 (+) Transcript_32682:459-1070(+)
MVHSKQRNGIPHGILPAVISQRTMNVQRLRLQRLDRDAAHVYNRFPEFAGFEFPLGRMIPITKRDEVLFVESLGSSGAILRFVLARTVQQARYGNTWPERSFNVVFFRLCLKNVQYRCPIVDGWEPRPGSHGIFCQIMRWPKFMLILHEILPPLGISDQMPSVEVPSLFVTDFPIYYDGHEGPVRVVVVSVVVDFHIKPLPCE